MAASKKPQIQLDPEHIDDVLYYVRTDDKEELDSLLQQLCQHYKQTIGEILLQCIDPQSGHTILHYSSANGLQDMTASIIKNLPTDSVSAFVNHCNNDGNTALHWAALNGHVAIAKQLIGAGADMWIKNSAGHLALFEAERAEKNEVVQYLLEAGGKEVEHTGTEAEEDGDIVASSSEAALDGA